MCLMTHFYYDNLYVHIFIKVSRYITELVVSNCIVAENGR